MGGEPSRPVDPHVDRCELHKVKVCRSGAIPKQDQLAWKIAEVATDVAPIDAAAQDMVICRVIDNAGVATAACNRRPVVNARSQALAHPRKGGATVLGLANDRRFCAAWAAWANGTAVRELDFHDTFLAADYAHPADTIPPILAVAQQVGKKPNGQPVTGFDVIRGILVAYEIQISLVKGICLHKHKKDHIAHLCPAQAAGIGALLALGTDTIYQAVQQAVHVSFTTRQSRKGEISSWKAYAPAHAGKLAVEAVDRAMRGEKSPSPIYEGEDSVLAYMLDGPNSRYQIPLPKRGEPKTAILESYTKEHSAEYQAQALIDLAFRMRRKIADLARIQRITIHTSDHTHFVIGTGANDPEKMDPNSSRETLDHSAMYIFAVALQDGRWHHEESYTRQRASRSDTVSLWQGISTQLDAKWTQLYHAKRAFGARVEIELENGKTVEDELWVANAHPQGEAPFDRKSYTEKFETLTEGILSERERVRFLDVVHRLPTLATDLVELNVQLEPAKIESCAGHGIF